MRFLAILLASVFLLSLPAAAQNLPYRGECRKLTKQIARYERDAEWARERDNELWEQANLDQIARMTARRNSLCPDYAPDDRTAEQIAAFLAAAAKLAIKYFTFGQLGL